MQPPSGSAGNMPWTTVIGPARRTFDLRLHELWRSRDLIALFVWRDFVAAYKQTILGPLWHIVQPVMTTLTFVIIFGNIAGLSTDGRPTFLFYLSGTILWTYFSTTLTKTANSFIANAGLYGKVYFHRLAIPFSVVCSSLIAFAIQLGVVGAGIAYYIGQGASVGPNVWVLLSPILLAITAGYALGLGIIISALTTRYRDLAQVVGFGTQLMMYATPVIYPLSAVPAAYRPFMVLNPMSAIVEAFRYGLLGAGTVSGLHLLYSGALLVVVLVIALLLLNRVERTFMDTV